MKVSDRMLNLLKARFEHLLDPKEIRRVRKIVRSISGDVIMQLILHRYLFVRREWSVDAERLPVG